ncbi:hypothetical protein HNQ51_000030 [Inhella inkyongensis]|uniref:YCII-related domain-containing protein n=1 Tax=Inhella inkyongensis TaxID=392593 RepID=A0A840RVR0_9BURK|nr:YciI family protein [Inhella inkyongensis]MBB5202737.1 hypothetical protein [Inhella inkyongensis]
MKTPLATLLALSLSLYTPHSAGEPNSAGDYLVLAEDAEGVDTQLMTLAQVHWDYMDRFADRLLFRGPLLSADGRRHAGSLHLIRAPSAAFAQRFALDEPYHRAGLFARVQVLRFHSHMAPLADVARAADARSPSAFVQAHWPARDCPTPPPSSLASPWWLLGFVLAADGRCEGMAGVLPLPPEAARATAAEWLLAQGLSTHTLRASRWRPGGRR